MAPTGVGRGQHSFTSSLEPCRSHGTGDIFPKQTFKGHIEARVGMPKTAFGHLDMAVHLPLLGCLDIDLLNKANSQTGGLPYLPVMNNTTRLANYIMSLRGPCSQQQDGIPSSQSRLRYQRPPSSVAAQEGSKLHVDHRHILKKCLPRPVPYLVRPGYRTASTSVPEDLTAAIVPAPFAAILARRWTGQWLARVYSWLSLACL